MIRQTKRKTIFIGNPGVGKSTLLNAAIGKAIFKSGLSIGTGLTTVMKMVEVDGEYWFDTPGLDDLHTRQQAAEAIAKALRHGDGEYRLIFVVTEEALRIRSADLTTMTLVLDAIKAETDQEYPFGVIVNKMDPKIKEVIESSEDAWIAFTGMLQPTGYAAPKVMLYPRVEELIGAVDAVHDPPQYFYNFLDDVQPIRITPPQVEDIKHEEFDKLQKEYEKILEEKRRNDKWLKVAGYVTAAVLGGIAVASGVAATGAVTSATAAAVSAAAEAASMAAAAAGAGEMTVALAGATAAAGVEGVIITGEAVALGAAAVVTGVGSIAAGRGASKL